jgi:catechol 2,3-dioxygenase-like lactoylglutathione lyase family enzyme
MMDTTTPRFESVTPRIPVPDIESALAFYIDLLGFDLAWKWGEPLTHAGICRDSVSLDLIVVPPGRQGTAMAYIRLERIDAYYTELRARNVTTSGIGNRAYGLRDFEVVDPSGNRLAFGEPLEV